MTSQSLAVDLFPIGRGTDRGAGLSAESGAGRRAARALPDPNVFSDSDIEVGAVPGRRAENS